MITKICGITSETEVEYLNEAKPDLAGFVMFYPKSRRNVSVEHAVKVKALLDEGIKSVAVVVSPTVEQTEEIAKAGFDYIQIHGELSDEVLAACKTKIIKAFNVHDMSDFEKYKDSEKISGFVMDASEPGSGRTFDWDILKDLPRTDKFVILAGGLNPGNVDKAFFVQGIDGVDTSSGVENEDGTGKSREKILEFVKRGKALMVLDRHDYTPDMPVIRKRTVRAIILENGLYATQRNRAGEYKIPGGGVEGDETDVETLAREVREECGMVLIPETVKFLGYILEYRADIFEPDKKYCVETVYYRCEVTDERYDLMLTESEKEAGFECLWVPADEIIRNNNEVIKETWKIKDTRFLEQHNRVMKNPGVIKTV